MLFRRRQQPGIGERVRLFFWPRRSFSRSARYFARRTLRLKATPHAVAAGVAAGVFAAWTPLLGLQFILAFALAYAISGNMIAAGLGTWFCNPLSFPVIWATTYKLGHWMLYGAGNPPPVDLLRLLRGGDLEAIWDPVMEPMLIGSLAPGLACAAAFYGVTFLAVGRYQERRRLRLAERRMTVIEGAMRHVIRPQAGRTN